MKVLTISSNNGMYTPSCPSSKAQMKYFKKILKENGIEETRLVKETDYIVYSSCAFDGKTMDENIKDIKDLMKLQQVEGNHFKVLLTGCFIKNFDGDKISDDVILIKDNVWSKAALDYILEKEKNITVKDMLNSKVSSYANDNEILLSMNIVGGCINKCSFCKTNYINNKVESLPYDELLEFLKDKIKNGTKALDLHGDSLNLYGIDLAGKPILHKLLHELGKEKDLNIISLGEVTPQNMYPELLKEIKNNSKVKAVTLQLESASDEVLKNMNRNYTISRYDDIASSIINSGKYVDTILMSGFPLETYDDLSKTIEYIEKRRIYVSGVCQYVDSPHIPSHDLKQLARNEKMKHTRFLKDRIKDINIEIQKENIEKMANGIVFRKYDDCIFTVGGTRTFAYSTKHKDLKLGDVIEEPPKTFVKKSKYSNKNIYKY